MGSSVLRSPYEEEQNEMCQQYYDAEERDRSDEENELFQALLEDLMIKLTEWETKSNEEIADNVKHCIKDDPFYGEYNLSTWVDEVVKKQTSAWLQGIEARAQRQRQEFEIDVADARKAASAADVAVSAANTAAIKATASYTAMMTGSSTLCGVHPIFDWNENNQAILERFPASMYYSKGGKPTSTPPSSNNMSPVQIQIALIDAAKYEVRALFYSLTPCEATNPLIEKLIEVHGRGVDVKIILDKGQENGSPVKCLRENGVHVRLLHGLTSHSYATMHEKLILVDKWHLLFGSSNSTWNADQNSAENLCLLHAGVLTPSSRPFLFDLPRSRFEFLWDMASR